jgi:diguanylate cyclase (GGDEF)-like protein
MLELDNVEPLIGKYGPETSDSVLREIGLLLQTNVRRGDIACRFGDQVFILILPQGNLEVGRQRVESLRDLVRTLEISSGAGPVGPITLSIGLAVFPAHGRTVEALLRSAEAALSRAKISGGDCIVIPD